MCNSERHEFEYRFEIKKFEDIFHSDISHDCHTQLQRILHFDRANFHGR